MGHLINSNAMRIGWFSNWSDSWYSDHVYYSEFLYNIMRVRLFLVYFFSSKKLEKTGYFYSHFEIIQKYNSLHVNVYFYDGWIESLIDDLFFEHYVEVRKLNTNPSKRKPIGYFESWKLLVVLNWQINFSFIVDLNQKLNI